MGPRGLLLAGLAGVLVFVVLACPKKVFTCSTDTDCDAGFACRSEQCISTSCTPGCDAGFTCDNAVCVSPDCPTGPCAAGLVCDLSCLAGVDASVCSGACVSPACINICPQGEACTSEGTCILKGCIGKICPYNYICIDAQCFDRGCLDAGCPGGTSCASGICYQTSCPDAGPCGVAQVCFDGGCADPLCFGIACATGQVCRNGLCNLPTCSDGIQDGNETDIDCGGVECSPCNDGQKCKGEADCLSRFCNNGICAACTSYSQCSSGEVCDSMTGYCQGCVWNNCLNGQICDPSTQLCGPCGDTKDCDGGGVCLGNGTCGPCTMTSQCGNQVCNDAGVCIPCNDNSQCINGKVCVGQACLPCTNDNQCTTPLKCNTSTGQCSNCITFYLDNDGDGYGQTGKSTCVQTQPAGYAALPGDCDDNDSKVNPGQTAYFTIARDGGSFDYNCSGTDEKDPTYACADSLVSCDTCTATMCTGTPGYDAGVPACGGSGAFCYCGAANPTGGYDGGTQCDPSLTGIATCSNGGCTAGQAEYQTICGTQQIGCH
jgi:hypothetical protein